MKFLKIICIAILLGACNKSDKQHGSVEFVTAESVQRSLFTGIVSLANGSIAIMNPDDSLAFLILPIQVSCPSCRKKTIDSLMKHQASLLPNHYVIISAAGGRKTIGGYFKEQNYELPLNNQKLMLDTVNLAYSSHLYTDKPTIYYSVRGKVYKKVSAVPSTVRDDLSEFFSNRPRQ